MDETFTGMNCVKKNHGKHADQRKYKENLFLALVKMCHTTNVRFPPPIHVLLTIMDLMCSRGGVMCEEETCDIWTGS